MRGGALLPGKITARSGFRPRLAEVRIFNSEPHHEPAPCEPPANDSNQPRDSEFVREISNFLVHKEAVNEFPSFVFTEPEPFFDRKRTTDLRVFGFKDGRPGVCHFGARILRDAR